MEEREANNRWMQGVATSLGFNTFVNDSLEEARARARQAEERAQHVERQLQEVLAKLGATQKPAGEPTPTVDPVTVVVDEDDVDVDLPQEAPANDDPGYLFGVDPSLLQPFGNAAGEVVGTVHDKATRQG